MQFLHRALAISEYTKFSNREGIFGDPDIMSLTKEDSAHMIPAYQFWADHGKTKHLRVAGVLAIMSCLRLAAVLC